MKNHFSLKIIQNFKTKKRGASLLAYGLVVGLISVVAISSVSKLGNAVSSLFGTTASTLQAVADEANGIKILLTGAGTAGDPFTWEDDTSVTSCNAYLSPSSGFSYTDSPANGDGVYLLDPDGEATGNEAFPATCNMTADGGGWTLLGHSDNGDTFNSGASYATLLDGGTVMQNWFGDTIAITASTTVPSGYMANPHYMLLGAFQDNIFSQFMIMDNNANPILDLPAATSLNGIFDASGTGHSAVNLTQNGLSAGVVAIYGAPAQVNNTPCVYMAEDATSCSQFFAGDSGDQSIGFAVVANQTCLPSNIATSRILGSADCYDFDTGLNKGGGAFSTIVYRALSNVGFNLKGYDNTSSEIYFR